MIFHQIIPFLWGMRGDVFALNSTVVPWQYSLSLVKNKNKIRWGQIQTFATSLHWGLLIYLKKLKIVLFLSSHSRWQILKTLYSWHVLVIQIRRLLTLSLQCQNLWTSLHIQAEEEQRSNHQRVQWRPRIVCVEARIINPSAVALGSWVLAGETDEWGDGQYLQNLWCSRNSVCVQVPISGLRRR